MSGKYFLDTNVLVYSFDDSAPEKRERARELVDSALSLGQGVISYQVVQEFLTVSTRKFIKPLSTADAAVYLERVLVPLCEVFGSPGLFRSGLTVAERYRYSIYDSLIVAAAKEAGCTVLYSEDIQRGQRIEGIEIVNPFLE